MGSRPKLGFTLPRALICALLCSGSLAARADEPETARLRYESEEPVRCPDEQAFRDIVAGRLGYDPFRPDAAREVHASIRRKGRAFVGSVQVTDAQGRPLGGRDLEAPEQDCAELANALAIAISIAFDPLGSVPASVPESVPQAAPVLPVEPPPPSEPAAPPPAPERAPASEPADLGMVTRASFAVDAGLLPGLTVGPVLAAGLRVNRFALLAEGRVDLMPSVATTDGGDRVDAALFSAGPSACVSFSVAVSCLGLELGAFQGRGVDVTDSRTQTSFFAAGSARAGLDIPLGKVLSFSLLGELRVPLVRTSLSIEGSTVWNAPALGGGALVGLGATFL
jgi:hypothetical protein